MSPVDITGDARKLLRCSRNGINTIYEVEPFPTCKTCPEWLSEEDCINDEPIYYHRCRSWHLVTDGDFFCADHPAFNK